MKLQRRFLEFGLVFAVMATAGAERASAVTYVASLLDPVGFTYSNAYGIGGSGIAGTTGALFDASHPYHFSDAALWDVATNSLTNLNPGLDWHSSAFGASNDSQVGQGSSTDTTIDHALLWHGTAASFVDLNPAGFYTSQAYGVSGNNQVGGGGLLVNPNGGLGHALLWHGTAASAVDLNPSGYAGSVASGVVGDNIVGTAALTGNNDHHATLWTGSSHLPADLHPAGFADSAAFGVSADSQVGTGYLASYFSGDRHALLWHGTVASAIDLNPAGFIQSEAWGVAGTMQVGFGMGPSTGNQNHALMWQGTAGSAVDLHALLAAFPQAFVSSEAHGIDANGVIVGFAMTSNLVPYAVKWTPVPEPSTILLSVIGLGMIGGRCRIRLQVCNPRI